MKEDNRFKTRDEWEPNLGKPESDIALVIYKGKKYWMLQDWLRAVGITRQRAYLLKKQGRIEIVPYYNNMVSLISIKNPYGKKNGRWKGGKGRGKDQRKEIWYGVVAQTNMEYVHFMANFSANAESKDAKIKYIDSPEAMRGFLKKDIVYLVGGYKNRENWTEIKKELDVRGVKTKDADDLKKSTL